MRVIPLWLRLLAGCVAAAAALAILLLIRDVPGQDIGLARFSALAARALLFLCVVLLFGYVAATGLPPSHWWRSAGRPVWPAEPELPLTPDFYRFLERLKDRHPGLRECWLLHSPKAGEWRLLARAGPPVLEAARGDWDIRRSDLRLYLLDEQSQTVAPAWGRSTPVAFATWDWEPQSDVLAEYRCPVTGEIRLAQRLWSA